MRKYGFKSRDMGKVGCIVFWKRLEGFKIRASKSLERGGIWHLNSNTVRAVAF
jgi:hypothetical protein